MRIREISESNRPRERFLSSGAGALSDAELLAIILQNGTREENVIDMSNRLISRYGLGRLFGLSVKELQEIRGIGPAKAIQIKALFEFNKRNSLYKEKGKKIRRAEDVFSYCYPIIGSEDREHLMALHLDSANRIIKDEIVSIGTLNSSLIHPREVFKPAIRESSNSIIVAHNHPSGIADPSDEDIRVTDILYRAGELLSIKLLDHVIVGSCGYYSFKESSLCGL